MRSPENEILVTLIISNPDEMKYNWDIRKMAECLLYESKNPGVNKIFHKAIELVNLEMLRDDYSLVGISEEVTYGNSYETSKKLCKLLKSGVAAIFGPTARSPANHVTSICDAKEIPLIEFRWDSNTKLPAINLHPNPKKLIVVLRDLVQAYGWKGFTILYESGSFLPVLSDLLQLYGPNGYTITVRRYDMNLNGDYRNVLRTVKKSEEKRIIIIGSIESLSNLLKQVQQVGLLNDQYQYIIANLDLQTIDLEPFRYSEANITGLRFINPKDTRVKQMIESLYENISECLPDTPCKMTTDMGLVYDGVLLLAEMLKHFSYPHVFQTSSLSCHDSGTWENGYSLVNYMKTTSVHGLSGEIIFDNQGLRNNIFLEIVELTLAGLIPVGTWNSSNGLQFNRETIRTAVGKDDRSLRNKTFIVLTAVTAPYGMLKSTSEKLQGNDQYEGFGIELIHELSLMLGFNYTFRLQKDNLYGSLNRETNQWNGMIKEILEGRADLAITDLTMTSDRESAVDFTMPFMNLGISILYRKPTKEPPKLFSFMSPFSKDVWLYLGAAYIGVSLSLFILGRLSPAEWDNPYPCVEEPTVLENQFSFRNSFWFTIGALLQQGSEIAPKAPSTRTVASIWWFFTLIMVSSYTANLAAFLTIESLSSPISSAEDLANGNGGVKYGAKRDGSTINFFKDAKYPTYQRMYEYMKEHPELLPSTNEEGVEKVENENYAFLMESTSIEYRVERKCNLTQIGGLLDEKGYGIAMRKNSPYRDALSQAVLSLQEQGKLSKMKTKWWKEKRGGGACSDTGEESGAVPLEVANLGGVFLLLILGSFAAVIFSIVEMLTDIKRRVNLYKKQGTSDKAEELGMANLGGVYFVLLVGSILASFYGICEWLFVVYYTSRSLKVSFKREFLEELRFLMRCKGNTKTVKYKNNPSIDSRSDTISLESLDEQCDEIKLHNSNGNNKPITIL